jgi:hypothetical protein
MPMRAPRPFGSQRGRLRGDPPPGASGTSRGLATRASHQPRVTGQDAGCGWVASRSCRMKTSRADPSPHRGRLRSIAMPFAARSAARSMPRSRPWSAVLRPWSQSATSASSSSPRSCARNAADRLKPPSISSLKRPGLGGARRRIDLRTPRGADGDIPGCRLSAQRQADSDDGPCARTRGHARPAQIRGVRPAADVAGPPPRPTDDGPGARYRRRKRLLAWGRQLRRWPVENSSPPTTLLSQAGANL